MSTLPPPSTEEQIWEVLQQVYDPEIPVNIVDLGLVYSVETEVLPDDKKNVKIAMTLTNPACVMGPMITEMIKLKVKEIADISDVIVDIVWEPTWNKDMISERGRMELGWL